MENSRTIPNNMENSSNIRISKNMENSRTIPNNMKNSSNIKIPKNMENKYNNLQRTLRTEEENRIKQKFLPV